MEPSKPTDDEELLRAEREALLAAMPPGDWARANSLARMAAYGLAEMDPDDLLQEALTDLLSLDRTWRRGVPPLVTLKVAMRSIASNARKKAANAPIDQYATVSTGEEDPPEGGPRPVHALDELSPADFADGREQLAWIERAVKGDSEAELVLTAWAMGYSGQEARSETGLDAKQFDAARQRLMRKLKPLAAVRNTK
jgi:hypothetical protein